TPFSSSAPPLSLEGGRPPGHNRVLSHRLRSCYGTASITGGRVAMASVHYHVFLSHTGFDKPAVEELARRLVHAGIEPWLDTWNLVPGVPWMPALEDVLARCDSCAVFIGPAGMGAWQHEEMQAAINRRVTEGRTPTEGGTPFRVIPVLLPGADRPERSRLPRFLTATTWVEFRATLDDEQAFRRLVSGIRGV